VIHNLDRVSTEVNRAQRELLRAILECDLRRTYLQDDCRDTAQWVSLRLGMNTWKARRMVACAHALEELPRCEDAFLSGQLSLDKLMELTRLATPQTEKKLVTWARRVAIATIRARADEARRIPKDAVEDAERVRALGYLLSEDNTRMDLYGSLPVADGMTLMKAIDRRAEQLPTDPEAHDPLGARRADALVALAAGQIAADPDPDRATVVFHVSFEGLFGDKLNGVFEDGRPLSPEAVSRLMCDSRIQAVLEEDGQIKGIGQTSRQVPPWLRRVLMRRDNATCTFFGCGAKAHLHAHHIVPWPLGPTDLDNLTLVCPFHHKLVHEGGWHVVMNNDQVDWFRPDWTPYIPRAGPVALAV